MPVAELPARATARSSELHELPDAMLVARTRAGEERAFEAIFKRHHPPLLSYCRHMLGNQDEAEDALQQAFIRVHKALLGGPCPRELRPWLYAIARNCCLSAIAARRPTTALEDHTPSLAGLSEQVHEREDLRELVGDIGRLPEQQRSALLLAELEDLPHQAIATIVGCQVSKVKALVYQARTTLIAEREARDASCREIREQLSVARGGELRRGPLRRHLAMCAGCSDFQHMLTAQRQSLAAVLPVLPAAGLAARVLSHSLYAGGVAHAIGAAHVGGASASTVGGGTGLGGSGLGGIGVGAGGTGASAAGAGATASASGGIGLAAGTGGATAAAGAGGAAGGAGAAAALGGGVIAKLAVVGAVAAMATAGAVALPHRSPSVSAGALLSHASTRSSSPRNDRASSVGGGGRPASTLGPVTSSPGSSPSARPGEPAPALMNGSAASDSASLTVLPAGASASSTGTLFGPPLAPLSPLPAGANPLSPSLAPVSLLPGTAPGTVPGPAHPNIRHPAKNGRGRSHGRHRLTRRRARSRARSRRVVRKRARLRARHVPVHPARRGPVVRRVPAPAVAIRPARRNPQSRPPAGAKGPASSTTPGEEAAERRRLRASERASARSSAEGARPGEGRPVTGGPGAGAGRRSSGGAGRESGGLGSKATGRGTPTAQHGAGAGSGSGAENGAGGGSSTGPEGFTNGDTGGEAGASPTGGGNAGTGAGAHRRVPGGQGEATRRGGSSSSSEPVAGDSPAAERALGPEENIAPSRATIQPLL